MRVATVVSRVQLHALVGAAALLVVAGGARADDGKTDHKDGATHAEAKAEQRTGSDSSVVTLGGVRIAIDPKTGDLRPLTPAESKKLADEMRRRFKPRDLQSPTLRPDGAMSAVVAPNVLRFSVARIRPDGSVTTSCVEGSRKAVEQLTTPAPDAKPAQPEEK
jgi:hypothetical protein